MINKIFILPESIDEGIVHIWHFQVPNKYEMAQFIIANITHYDNMFKNQLQPLIPKNPPPHPIPLPKQISF